MNLDKYSEVHSPGYVISIFKDNIKQEYVFGNRQVLPNTIKNNSDTLYDIASLTKVFTSTLIYMAVEEGKLTLDTTIFEINPNFINLKNVSVLDLLAHRLELYTDGYLGGAETKEEFDTILYSAFVKTTKPTYIDSHYIILGYLLETIYGVSYKELVQTKIFDRLDLESATFDPDPSLCASCNYEKGIDQGIMVGEPHDTKARIARLFGVTTAHASIFINACDMMKFLRSFLDCTLLSKETVAIMKRHDDINLYNFNLLKDLTEVDDINKMYQAVKKIDPGYVICRTYNYMGTRYRNDVKIINDLPDAASDDAIVFSGYTGPLFVIDFTNQVIILVMCNLVHNSFMGRFERKCMTDEIVDMIYQKLL